MNNNTTKTAITSADLREAGYKDMTDYEEMQQFFLNNEDMTDGEAASAASALLELEAALN